MTSQRSRILAVALAIAALVLLLGARAAAASTQTVTFDDASVSPGDFVTTQYASSAGVEFHDPNGQYGTNGFLPYVVADSGAHSSPNVGDIDTCQGGCGEFFYNPYTRGYLDTYASGISVYVGYRNVNGFPNNDTAQVSLTAYDSSNNQVGSTASTTVTKAGGFIQLSVTSGSANIAYFDVKAPATNDAGKPIAIDDLAITRPATPPPPDFTLGTTLPAVGMIAGDSVDVPIDVHRANGSNGNVSLSVASTPPRPLMTTSISPNPVTGTNSSTTMTVATNKDLPTSDTTLTVTGTPDSGAGSSSRTLKVKVHVEANCDRLVGASYISARTDGCFQRTSRGEEAQNTEVDVNGLAFTPLTTTGNGSDLIIDTSARTIKSEGNYRVSVMGQPDLELYSGRITWDLGGAVGDPKTVVDYDTNFQGKVKLKGLPIGHTKIALTKDDHARVTATVNLPFWPFKYFDSLSASPTFVTDNYHGANFGGLEIKFDKVEALGIGLKDVDINYVSGNTWSGRATVVLPFAPPLEIGAGIGLKDGDLDFLAGSVNGLNIQVGEGIFLQKIGFEADLHPPALSGTLGFSAGPDIAGKTAVSVDGTLKVTLADPFVVEVDGTAKVADKFKLGDAFVRYTSTGLFELGGKVSWELGVGSIEGHISGWLQDASAFDVEGSVQGCIHVPFFPDPCASASALVSSVGIAACVDLSVVSGGIGYYWGGSFDLFGGSCDLGPWRPAKSSLLRTAAGTAQRFTLPKGLPSVAFAVDGAGAAPSVTLAGPHGESVSVSNSQPFVRKPGIVATMDDNGTTYIEIKRPSAGVWTLTNNGAVAIRRVRESFGLPKPSVHAKVTGHGYKRTLRWHLKPINGQQVRFAEIGKGVRHLIKKTRAKSGHVNFHPAPGPGGKRQIVALVVQNGLPRTHLTVASYKAPATLRPAKPRHLRIRRHGTKLTITWRAPQQGFRHAVEVTIGKGKRVVFVVSAKKKSLTVKHVPRRYGAKVLIAGLTQANGRGPAAKASIKPFRKKRKH